jgi:hypothetical protein
MIHFDMQCRHGHKFEGWFPNSDAYEKQAAAREISCPMCQDTGVEKAPMAPNIATRHNAGPSPEMTVRHMLKSLRRAIEATCEDVGDRFAEEARRIHYGEADGRGIYGAATLEETEDLLEEGIALTEIPWLPTTDS